MSLDQLWTLAQVTKYNNADGSESAIDPITDWNLAQNVQRAIMGDAGATEPTIIAALQQDPRIQVTSTMIASLLGYNSDAFALTGLPISVSAGSEYGLRFWLAKLDNEGQGLASGAVHKYLEMQKGMLLPRQLGGDINTPATWQLEAIPIYDGTNDPYTIANNQSLPSTAGSDAEYNVGPVTINGLALQGVQSATYDPQIQETLTHGSGRVWAKHGGVGTYQPQITIKTTKSAQALADYGILGSQLSATAVLYLKKRGTGDTVVDDATAEHLSITINEGQVVVDDLTTSAGQQAQSAIRVIARKGSSAIVSVNTATAITTSSSSSSNSTSSSSSSSS